MGKKLNLPDDAQPLVQEIMTRIQRAQLANLSIDWGELKVSETYPAKLPELWAGRPVIVYGRYTDAGSSDEAVLRSTIAVRGSVEGEDVSWPLSVELPRKQAEHDALAKVWARQKIEDLMQQTFYQGSPAVEEMVTAIALNYKLMSQYTSFVAVDSSKAAHTTEAATPPRRMLVPVPLPAGTQWEGFFGDEGEVNPLFSAWGSRLSEKQSLARDGSVRLSLSGSLAKSTSARTSVTRFAFAEGAAAQGASPAPSATPGAGVNFGGLSGSTGFGRGGDAGGLKRESGLPRQAGAGGRLWAVRQLPGLRDQQRGDGRGLATSGFWAFYKGAEVGQAPEGKQLAQISDFEWSFAGRAISPYAAKLAEAAKAAFETANSKEKPIKGEQLRRLLAKAALLDSAAANAGQSNGSIAAQAIDRLNVLHQADVESWSEGLPVLKTKLNLVIRDQSLAEALAAISQAAGVEIRLTEGSEADGAALTRNHSEGSPRLSYLDLRQATVSQALDWIFHPLRLSWQPEGRAIAASSARRRAESGWIYDVSAIALPLEDDLKKVGDQAKILAKVQKATEEFIAVLHNELKVEEASLVWFGPGQLLLFGTPAQHAALADCIATLQEGAGKPAAGLEALSETTRKRFAARKEQIAAAKAADRKLEVALAHDHFSWQLLSAAAAGKLDLEALTELQIAWKAPHSSELLAGEGRPLLLRSLWTICEASHALPTEKELATLAAAAREKSVDAAMAALTEVSTNKGNLPSMASSIYAALVDRSNREYTAKLLSLLSATETDESTKDLRLLGRVLLGEINDADRKALGELLTAGMDGADPVALLAFACQKAGGSTWDQFRAQSRELLGEQPLPGDVVVLINRLSGRHSRRFRLDAGRCQFHLSSSN